MRVKKSGHRCSLTHVVCPRDRPILNSNVLVSILEDLYPPDATQQLSLYKDDPPTICCCSSFEKNTAPLFRLIHASNEAECRQDSSSSRNHADFHSYRNHHLSGHVYPNSTIDACPATLCLIGQVIAKKHDELPRYRNRGGEDQRDVFVAKGERQAFRCLLHPLRHRHCRDCV